MQTFLKLLSQTLSHKNKQALDAHQAIVIDVRGDVSYKAGHIKGALMIPGAEIDKHVDELPKDKLIVTYCS